MSRTICYITGTRADFGLMQGTLSAIHETEGLALQLIVTGMHLFDQYGRTLADVEASGLPIAAKVPVADGEPSGALMARNIGTMLTGFVDALSQLRPDVVMLLGDRGEMLAGAIAAIHLNIPVVHIHGGERSGTVDEPVRHAISKLSHVHFVATEASRDRLVRMGELAGNIHVTGAPGLDGLDALVTTGREALMADVGLDPSRPVALMVFHAVLQHAEAAGCDTQAMIQALHGLGIQVMALMPNSDAGGQYIREVLKQHEDDANVRVAAHFPRKKFVSWMAHADLMIGNSSSGIIEAATFGTPVLNVGSRQALREQSANVTDVGADPEHLRTAIVRALAMGHQTTVNVYGDGQTAGRIASLLARLELDRSLLLKANAY